MLLRTVALALVLGVAALAVSGSLLQRIYTRRIASTPVESGPDQIINTYPLA